MNILRKCDAILEKVTIYFCAFLFATIVLICITGVFFRYVINSPLMWTEEVMRFMAIWLILVGSSLTVRADGHTSIDLWLLVVKSQKAIRAIVVFTRTVAAAALIAFIPFSIDLMEKMGGTVAAATRLPMRYVYLAFLVGAILMLIGFVKVIPTLGKNNNDEGSESI